MLDDLGEMRQCSRSKEFPDVDGGSVGGDSKSVGGDGRSVDGDCRSVDADWESADGDAAYVSADAASVGTDEAFPRGDGQSGDADAAYCAGFTLQTVGQAEIPVGDRLAVFGLFLELKGFASHDDDAFLSDIEEQADAHEAGDEAAAS